jgi:hypothetical protein
MLDKKFNNGVTNLQTMLKLNTSLDISIGIIIIKMEV